MTSFDQVDAPETPVRLVTPKSPWKTEGSIDTQGSTPAVGARDSTTMNALDDTIEIVIPDDANGLEIRYQTSTDGDDHVVEGWAIANDKMADGSDDSYILGFIHTIKGGTQVGPNSNVFCDTLTCAGYLFSEGVVNNPGGNNVATYRVDVRGYEKILLIATTLESGKTLKADVRWY